MADEIKPPLWERLAFLIAPATGRDIGGLVGFGVWLIAAITLIGAAVWTAAAWHSGDVNRAQNAMAWRWTALAFFVLQIGVAIVRRRP